MKYLKVIYLLALSIFVLLGCSSDPLVDENNLAEYLEGDGEDKETPIVPEPIDSIIIEAPGTVGPEIIMGAFNYSGAIPDESSKIPTCQKEENPEFVSFRLVDDEGNLWERQSPVTKDGNIFTSVPDSLPIGDYTVLETKLMSSEGEDLYAIPNSEDTDFHAFANTILPLDITITEDNTTIEGIAMCYTPSIEAEEGTFAPGVEFKEIQEIFIYMPAADSQPEPGFESCIEWLHVWIDDELVIQRFIFSGNVRYDLLIPAEYETLNLYTYHSNTFEEAPVQAFNFTREDPYNPEIDGALVFDQCWDDDE